MSKDTLNIGGRADMSEQAPEVALAERRERLAQQIGRLLARVWLRRRREPDNDGTATSDLPTECRESNR